ncbi:hypothetical protein [Micromonospora sp. WMMD812]|uniref:hypothetical protein n=1 Tax=Micromonospora sp. WMMD812 TaxID=3015152 RepID=UPI00248CAEC4|nr:hypothetical protein [Micromonospora sp. WMMD812]WBB68148.1 hypothetical protein O7603_01855 [Micromonospora sp. WMMD812]
MELHRNWKPYVRGPGLLALAVVLAFSPELLAATGREFVLGDWIGYLMALLALVGGIGAVRDSRRAFSVRIDEHGVTWVSGTHTLVFPWAEVNRVTVEQRPNSGKFNRPSLLTVWTADSTERPLPPDVQLTGLRGYRVADLHNVKESTDQVVAALRQTGGDRYPAPAS